MEEYDILKVEELVLEGFGLSSERYISTDGKVKLNVTDAMHIGLPKEYVDENSVKYIVPTDENLKVILYSYDEMSIIRDKVKSDGDLREVRKQSFSLDGEQIVKVQKGNNNSIIIYVYYDEFHYYKMRFVRPAENKAAKIEIDDGRIMTLSYDDSNGLYCSHNYNKVVDKISDEDFTIENIIKLICKYMKGYIDGKFWNQKTMMGIAGISVAIGYCVDLFIKDLENRKKSSQK